MNGCESSSYCAVKGEASDCEDLANADEHVTDEEKLHFSVDCQYILRSSLGDAYLRPTAARLRFERQKRKAQMASAMPSTRIDPGES